MIAKKSFILAILSVCLVFSFAGKSFSFEGTVPYASDRVLMKFNNDLTEDEIHTKAYSSNIWFIKKFKKSGVCVFKLQPGERVEYKIQALAGDASISYVEPDYFVKACKTPNDPYYNSYQWYHKKIDAPSAWDITTGSSTIVVAVLDSGVDYNHSDLSSNMWINTDEIPDNGIDDDYNGYIDDYRGWDFVNADKDPIDDEGHGTFVAGVLGAVGNNNSLIAGTCWTVKIMPVKFLDETGQGLTSDAVSAIEYAVANGAKVINNSWGGPGSNSLQQAIIAAGNAGRLVVSAAGNDGMNIDSMPTYPAAYNFSNTIAVGASNKSDYLASWSNYGKSRVDLVAPGLDMFSLGIGGGFETSGWGTSYAAPLVSGTAALIWAAKPGLSYSQVKNYILATVDKFSNLSSKCVTGGRLNTGRALEMAVDVTPPSKITNLAAAKTSYSRVQLQWTAPGDNGDTGTAAGYDIRYSTEKFTSESNWESLPSASDLPTPGPSGTVETYILNGLSDGQKYYIAIKAYDLSGNYSDMSNRLELTTVELTLVSSKDAGGSVVSFKTQKDATKWAADNLIDGKKKATDGGAWSSEKKPNYPQSFVFELSGWAKLGKFKFLMKGITDIEKWPRKVKVYASRYPDKDFSFICEQKLNKTDTKQSIFLSEKDSVYRYIKLKIKNNCGNRKYVRLSEFKVYGIPSVAPVGVISGDSLSGSVIMAASVTGNNAFSGDKLNFVLNKTDNISVNYDCFRMALNIDISDREIVLDNAGSYLYWNSGQLMQSSSNEMFTKWWHSDDVKDIAAFDINNDFINDLLITIEHKDKNVLYSDLYILLNDGKGYFNEPLNVASIYNSCSVGAIDVNGDKNLDLWMDIAGQTDDPILINDGLLKFNMESGIENKSYIEGSEYLLIDAENDGDSDLVKYSGDGVEFFINHNNQLFNNEAVLRLPETEDMLFMQKGSIDTDNQTDLIAAYKEGDVSYIAFWINEKGVFSEVSKITGVFTSVAVEDVDGDSDSDMVTIDAEGKLKLFINESGNYIEETFERMSDGLTQSNTIGDVIFADLDGDGDKDIVTISKKGSPAAYINISPVLSMPAKIEIDAEISFSYKVNAECAEGRKIAFYAYDLPSGSYLDNVTGILFWDNPVKGSYQVEFIVSDGMLKDRQITVLEVK